MSLSMRERLALSVASKPNGAHPNELCSHRDVDQDLLHRLVEQGWMTGPHPFATKYGLAPNMPTPYTYREHLKCCVEPFNRAGEAFFHFKLTTSGWWQLGNDPLWMLLRTLREAPRQTLPMHFTVVVEAGLQTVRHAWSKGWVTAHWAGDGREIPQLTTYEWRHAKDVKLRATAAARHAIG